VRPVLEGTLSGDAYTTMAKYVWEGDSYYDPLVFASLSGQWRYFAYDGLGSSRQLLDANQTVTDSYSYEAFGNLLSDGGPTPNLAKPRPATGGRGRHGGAASPHLATYLYVGSLGYYTTGARSLLDLAARYYLREVGRFMSPDPLVPEKDNPPEWNRYPYAVGNPANEIDPTGHAACTGSY